MLCQGRGAWWRLELDHLPLVSCWTDDRFPVLHNATWEISHECHHVWGRQPMRQKHEVVAGGDEQVWQRKNMLAYYACSKHKLKRLMMIEKKQWHHLQCLNVASSLTADVPFGRMHVVSMPTCRVVYHLHWPNWGLYWTTLTLMMTVVPNLSGQKNMLER
jgi:hypothetical protein